jgi:hypothetical protein
MRGQDDGGNPAMRRTSVHEPFGIGGTLAGDPPVVAQTDRQATGLVNLHHT